MSGTIFKKKSSKDDNDNVKVHTALPGAKERGAKNDDAAIARTSRACTGSSRIVGTLRNRVSLGLWERVLTTVPRK